jgi:hypothetical protein
MGERLHTESGLIQRRLYANRLKELGIVELSLGCYVDCAF